jgi:type II secretory pathway pseudopilin PulG
MPRTPSRSGRAFTIVEAMIVLGIIALLAGLVFGALHFVKGSGDAVAERAMVVSLKQGVEQFKQQFGFLPPLVIDTPDPPNPTDQSGRIYVWSNRDLYDPNTTLNGSPGSSDPTLRQCFSQYSLSYYVVGSLDDLFDEVNGPGFTAPSSSRDGSFSGTGRRFDPFVDPSLQKTRAGISRVPAMPANLQTMAALPGDKQKRADRSRYFYILDRWSDGSGSAANDRPIRYYRWQPSYYPKNDPKAGQVQYWNVPIAVGGDVNNATNPPGKPELKSAEFAIVSAGPDRRFGDEPGLTPQERLNAAADNIVEVGR